MECAGNKSRDCVVMLLLLSFKITCMASRKVSAAKAVPAWKEGGRWKVRRDDALAFDALQCRWLGWCHFIIQNDTPTLTLLGRIMKITFLQ